LHVKGKQWKKTKRPMNFNKNEFENKFYDFVKYNSFKFVCSPINLYKAVQGKKTQKDEYEILRLARI
jgi:hypothetical protein